MFDAAGYARSRPPVHPIVIAKAGRRLGIGSARALAVDVGCGAGLSTAPLTALAGCVIGVEPAEAMLRYGRETAPAARFVCARAEQLPLPDACADLVTAAGSLNFVADLDRSLAEIRRILKPGGAFVVYDFSQGRRFADGGAALERWFEQFHGRYPPPRGASRSLDLDNVEPFAIPLALTPAFYLDYMMTETNVAAAIAAGTPKAEIRAWCEAGIDAAFDGCAARDVIFEGYIAYLA